MTITNTAQNTGGIVTGNNADTTLRPNTPAIPIGSEQPVPPTPGTDNPVPNGSTVSPT